MHLACLTAFIWILTFPLKVCASWWGGLLGTAPLFVLNAFSAGKATVSLRQKVSIAFGKALEADLTDVFLRSDATPRALLTLVLGSHLKHFALWT